MTRERGVGGGGVVGGGVVVEGEVVGGGDIVGWVVVGSGWIAVTVGLRLRCFIQSLIFSGVV